MKILFLSDIHGSLPALESVLKFYDEGHYDLLVLLGDILNYGPRNGLCPGLDPQAVAARLNERVAHLMCVRGNCDSEVDQMLLEFPIQGTYSMLVVDGLRFFLTHGHVYNEKHLPQRQSCDVFVYGTPISTPCRQHAWRKDAPPSSIRVHPHSPREVTSPPLPPTKTAPSRSARSTVRSSSRSNCDGEV